VKILEGLKSDAPTRAESVRNILSTYGFKLDDWKHEAGPAFKAGSNAYGVIGKSERDMCSLMGEKVVAPLKLLLNNEVKVLDAERKVLSNRRLDMDTLKNKKHPDAAELSRLENGFKEQQEKVRQLCHDLEKKVSRAQLKALVDIDLAHYKTCVHALEELNTKL